MAELSVEKTYATALLDAATELGKEDLIEEEASAVMAAMDENPDLLKLLAGPTVSVVDKHAMIKNIFEGKICEELLNFMYILADKRRYDSFPNILKTYKKLLEERRGFSYGVVYSVTPLSAERIAKLEEKTGEMLGEGVKLENRIDTKLIGGIKIFLDGKVIDASYKTRLNKLTYSMLD